MSYVVFVDDNFHYMDRDERYSLGEFDSVDLALAACKQLVNDFLADNLKPSMTAEQLYSAYVSFGEDPFIIGTDVKHPFSAWAFAEMRCKELCPEEQNHDA